MLTKSQILLPPKPLASCIAGCIVRDTRQATLSDTDRVNYFPATPLFSATLILEGRLHIAHDIINLDDLRERPSAAPKLFGTPQNRPQMSWSPGPILALTIAFFPDAWQRLGGTLDGAPPESLSTALEILETEPLETAWPGFWAKMSAIWMETQDRDHAAGWTGSDKLKDWTNHLIGKLVQTGSGRSLRSAQRHLQRWTGQSRQSLEFFTKVEEVHRLVAAEPTASPAELAVEAGFSDQSHLGRVLKRATGFSPVSLNQKIATEEPFWCYRLLGERF